jgi:predicted phage-related endonuclease
VNAPTALAVRQGSPEWEAERVNGLGASDMPIVVGEKDGLLALWAVKAGLMEPEPIDEQTAKLFRVGHLMEPVIAQLYTEETGRPLRRVNRMLQSREWPVARASIDRESAVKGERRAVELKNTRSPRWGDFSAVPGDVQVQCQWQMYVGGYEVVDVGVLGYGSSPHVLEVPRDDAWIADLLYLAREFWGYVQAKTRPPIDGSESTRRALVRLHPADDGTMLPSAPEFVDLARQLVAAKAAAKAAEDAEGSISNAIRALLGDAAGVEGCFTYRKNKDSLRINWPAVANSYRQLLVQQGASEETLDTLQSIHSETSGGARVLRTVYKESAS